MQNKQDIPYFQEVLRKSIHLCSLSIPIIYSFITREMALLLLLPVFSVVLLLDVGRRFFPSINGFVLRFFGKMLRAHEQNSSKFTLNGATYVLLSAIITILLFPKIIAITAFTILIISDIFSALIGRRFGKHRFFDKSLEGSIAFVLSAILCVVFIGNTSQQNQVYYFAGVIASVVGAIVEAASVTLRMDDNFSIPMSVGLTLWIILSKFETLQLPF